MKNLRLSLKLIGAFVIVSLITMIIGLMGTVKIRAIDKKDMEMYELNTKPLGEISAVSVIFQKTRGVVRDIIIDKYIINKDINPHIEKIKEFNKIGLAEMKKFEESIKADEVRQEYEHLKAELGAYFPLRDKLITLINDGKRDEAIAFMRGDVSQQADKVQASIDKLVEMKINLAKTKADENTATANGAVWFTWIISALGTIIAIAFGIFLSISITRPLNRVIGGLAEGASQVAAASSQVSSSSQSLAEGASEQASSVEETSSSTEELAAMTKQNAANAQQAKAMMTEAAQIVENVNKQMRQMVEAIEEITKSSSETGKIIKTIDEIAFQTNLLALNAAVEAARAGEAGAGFAVVADEVRNLAMRAADAAKHTNDLIDHTLNAVKNGSNITTATKEAFIKNVEIATKIGGLINEIEAASNEQSSGIDQINRAVNEMSKVVQSVAANAEESAAASEEMNAQAQSMTQYVEELAHVIGGNGNLRGNGNGNGNAAQVNYRGKTMKDISVITEKGAVKVSALKGSRFINPEQVIPLEENSFTEF